MAGLLHRLFKGTVPTTAQTPRRPRLRHSVDDYAVIYAIGDVHGCYDALIDAERRIISDARTIPGQKLIVLLGDYVDRGSRSRDVLQHLCSPSPQGFSRIALCGNHDDAFLQFLNTPRANMQWLEFGGTDTLYSYGVDAKYLLGQKKGVDALRAATKLAVPPAHIALLQSMPIALTVGELIFVHAGIRPGISLDSQLDQDLLWIREPFISKGPQLPTLVVHGHTPGKDPVFARGRIGIDTAAFATGNLTVLKIGAGEPSIVAAA